MERKDDEMREERPAALRADDNSVIDADGATVSSYGSVAVASGNSQISLRNATVTNMDYHEVDKLKDLLFDEFKKISDEAKSGDKHKKMFLVNLLSQIGSGTALGYLKINGYID